MNRDNSYYSCERTRAYVPGTCVLHGTGMWKVKVNVKSFFGKKQKQWKTEREFQNEEKANV